MKTFTFVILLLFILTACHIGSRKKSSALLEHSNLEYISKKIKKHTNDTLIIQGQFLGWSGRSCKYIRNCAFQTTRNDWAFRDILGNCVYVTGGKPGKLSYIHDNDVGTIIRLVAIIRQNTAEKIFLEYVGAKIIAPPTPPIEKEEK